jgi:transposase-like protein
MGTRRNFANEYKQQSVRLVTQCGVTVAQAARDFGLNPNLLRKWVREQAADPVHAVPDEEPQKLSYEVETISRQAKDGARHPEKSRN